MRGFHRRTRVSEAVNWVDRQSGPLPAEIVPLERAHGRVLAENLSAASDVPQFARSAMDGYALRGSETTGAGDYNPLPFSLIGEALPGRPLGRDVPAGSAARIMTGAPLPSGADAVLPAEFARETAGVVEALAAVSPGKNVGPRGEDVIAGSLVAPAGRRLRPQDVGLLASVGVTELRVIRPPRVRLIATGNELVSPGRPRELYQIVDSNSLMLAGLIERDGGVMESRHLLDDDREAIRRLLVEPGADILLVSGGSSVGAEDHAPTLVAEAGELAIHGIAMRPSSPSGMGRIGAALVFLLPGNPVSCLCAYDFFAGRAIRRAGGRRSDWPYAARQLEVGRKIVSAAGRVDYCRVRLVEGKIEPIATSGASILSSTTRADAFVIVPEECEGYPPGAAVTAWMYDIEAGNERPD
ncbi:MAG: molybdopterin molybdenumtransferase MoeA [Planctomycetaceae bacterium]|nr:molybdopterin molybdenumtransferase MoeA [Planctomycetaceae bacterium]